VLAEISRDVETADIAAEEDCIGVFRVEGEGLNPASSTGTDVFPDNLLAFWRFARFLLGDEGRDDKKEI